jgi:hypothetical protein
MTVRRAGTLTPSSGAAVLLESDRGAAVDYGTAAVDSLPILSIDDFVPSEATMGLPVRTLVYRFAFLVLLILLAAGIVVELLRVAVGA